MKFQQKLRNLPAEFLDLVLPQECLGCGFSKTWLCDPCLKQILIRRDFPCLVCRRPAWQGQTHRACRREATIDGSLLASLRSQLLKDLVHSFKYENLKDLAPVLGLLLIKKITSSPLAESLLLNRETWLMPVPLHPHRLWERSYNQAELLAREVAGSFKACIRADIIRRVKDTQTQTDLPRAKRLKNVQGAFQVASPQQVKHRNIILIDDVLTTGSTLAEAADVLKSAGAKEVWVMALMRG